MPADRPAPHLRIVTQQFYDCFCVAFGPDPIAAICKSMKAGGLVPQEATFQEALVALATGLNARPTTPS